MSHNHNEPGVDRSGITPHEDDSEPTESEWQPAASGRDVGPPPLPGDEPSAPREPPTREAGNSLATLRREVRAVVGVARATADKVADLITRFDELEVRLAAVAGRLDEVLPTDSDSAEPDAAATPAMRWARMSTDEAETAWSSLAQWVDEVLCTRYRPNRRELPDCWPVHPRAVLELAWLRSSYIAAAKTETTKPTSVAEWHVRWYPNALSNIAAAIDPLECTPGRHRLTDHEHSQYERALEHARSGEPPPTLTEEAAADRPRYVPWLSLPPRDGGERRVHDGVRGNGRPRGSGHTPTPPSTRECWLPFFRDAVAEDLARRHRAVAPTQAL